jgi:ATP-dependent RNA helicase DeaD
MNNFKQFNFKSEINQALEDLRFLDPSPIQSQAIPKILNSEQNLIALAQTGTGKTAAFALPILEKINFKKKELQTLILCPTRELCLQLCNDIEKMGKYLKGLKVITVYGGAPINQQINELKRGGQIVVATPGRSHDLIRKKILKLQNIDTLVLDEADEMLDMGFKEDLDAILATTPKDKQILLFSATMSSSVRKIAEKYMQKANEISVGKLNSGSANISHHYYLIDGRQRLNSLNIILASLPDIYAIIFCRTKRQVQELTDNLKTLDFKVEALHGDVAQNTRTRIMTDFKEKKIQILIATDVAARGIDINNLSHIINYTLSDQDVTYTHRTGRTGRAENKGIAISLLSKNEAFKIRRLEKIAGQKFQLKYLPKKEDIYQLKIQNYLDKIKNIKLTKNIKIKEIDADFEKMSKNEIIQRFLTDKLNALNIDKESKETGNKRESGNKDYPIRAEINVGKAHGFDLQNFFTIINSDRTGGKIDIGRIDISARKTNFYTKKEEINRLKKIFSNKKIRLKL